MTPTRHLVLGMILTGAAGFVDAVGFIELGGYFTSFMSGNTTQGGTALASGHWPGVALVLTLVTLFFAGSVLGTLLAFSSTRWGAAAASGAVMLGVIATLVMVRAGFSTTPAMMLLAASAGAQNAILPMRGAVRLGATFVTGTLYVAGRDLALALRREAPPWRWAQHLVIWLGLFSGATLGALLHAMMGITALWLPIALYAAFTLGHIVAAKAARSS